MSFQTIKMKLLVICLVFFLTMAGLLCVLLCRDIMNGYEKMEREAGAHQVLMSQSNVDEDYLQIIRFFLWLSENGEVTDFLSGKTDNAYQPEYVKIEAYNTVLMQANSMFRSGFLEKCLISSSKGYLSFGSRTGMLSDQKLCWSGTAPIPAQERVCVVDSPFDANGGSVVRMVNEVYSSMSGKQIGWVNVYLNTDFIVNQFSGQFQENAPLFLGIGDGLYEIKSDGLRFIGPVEAVEYEVLETLTGGVCARKRQIGWI